MGGDGLSSDEMDALVRGDDPFRARSHKSMRGPSFFGIDWQ